MCSSIVTILGSMIDMSMGTYITTQRTQDSFTLMMYMIFIYELQNYEANGYGHDLDC